MIKEKIDRINAEEKAGNVLNDVSVKQDSYH